MSKGITKAKIVRAIEELPEDATIEDAIECLVFLHKIEVGLRQAEEGKTVSLDEVEARLKRRRRSKETE
jgi:predicted transcriptional regulator